MTREARQAYLASIQVATADLANKPDGVYNGAYTIKLPPGEAAANKSIAVAVTVKAGKIAAIAITSPRGFSSGKFYNALVTGPDGVIAKQSLDVDMVSGASYSSKVFLKAVEDALSN